MKDVLKMTKMCKSIAIMMVVLFLFPSQLVQATEPIDGMTETGTLQELEESALKMPTETADIAEWPVGPATHGRSAIVMDADTGAILYGKNIDEKEFPASITKVLTALIAFENSGLTDSVTISEECEYSVPVGYTHVGLKTGNVLTMEEALLATLLASANEAAYSVGENVGKNAGHDYQWFIEEMNRRCQELGGLNSNFVNTNGLHDENHYTTARDMAIIGRELCKYPEYFTLSQTLERQIPATATCVELNLWQGDMMLWPSAEDYYEPVIAGKTGYTDSARSTLFTVADDGNMRLICVVLHTYGANSYADTKSLLEYSFANFKKTEALGAEVVLPKDASAEEVSLEEVKNPNGTMTTNYLYKGQLVGTKTSAKKAETPSKDSDAEETPDTSRKTRAKTSMGKTIILIAIGAVLVLILLFLGGAILRQKRRRKGRRRRRHHRR
ncbi:D-alanyl-D-alanine carboxypeptidase (penicillin-binding protein 5/6) [Lachnospiraceae bacterium PF1-21]